MEGVIVAAVEASIGSDLNRVILNNEYKDLILETTINYQAAPIKNKNKSGGFVIEKTDTKIGNSYLKLTEEIVRIS